MADEDLNIPTGENTGNGDPEETGTQETNETPEVITAEEKATAVRLLFALAFEHIVPWGETGGDTGLSSRLKLQRNFEKIKTWIDSSPIFFLSRLYDDIAYGHITFNKGLTAMGYLDDEEIVRPGLEVKGDSTFTGNLSTPEFISNFIGGSGWAIQKKAFVNAAGVTEYKYVLECDGANFRETLRVYSLIASQLLGENDNRIITAMMEVHHYDPETGKVWLNTNCGKLYNTLRPGDYIMVKQFQPGNDVASGGDGYITKHYELIINQAGTGGATDENGDRLDWVTISGFTPGVNQEGTAETLITKGDTFCRVDSLTDAERKGIIQMISVGTNAPYMDIQYGLKTDPQHALKARLGNLSGLRTDDFGQLDNFGIYSNRGYFTGEFRNAQTGESLSARIITTQAQHVSLYKETTYDIGEDDNLVSNGFFVRELENWVVCTTSGAALDTQGVSGILYSGGMPLMVNGKVMSTSDKGKAIITDYDGVPMLKLSGAGVSQSFSSMDPNTTHKELTTENGSETADVPDTLYMGIRILPITEGTLKVEFLKQDGTTSGWQRTVVSTAQWMTVQSQDTTQAPWDYTGTGKMIVSYTGECLIRFVVLMNDPIESSRVDYWTKITQTARLIKAEANATYATRTMHSELSIEVGRIGTEVTNNKDASDRAKAAIEARLGDIETFDNNTATWITQTSNRLALWASSFDANGNVKDLAQLRIDVNSINTTIGTLATTAAMNSYVQQLQHDIDSIESDCNDNATAIRQTKSSLDLIAASFNADGTVKASGSIALYLSQEYSWISMSANYIDFSFTKEWRVWSGNNKLMWLDTSGDLHITGNFDGGNITQPVTVGADSNSLYKIIIYTDNRINSSLPWLSSGIKGVKDDTIYFNLGFAGVANTVAYPQLYISNGKSGSNRHFMSLNHDRMNFGSSSSNILTIGYTESDKKIYIHGNYSDWRTESDSSLVVGDVYIDNNGFLKVKKSA